MFSKSSSGRIYALFVALTLVWGSAVLPASAAHAGPGLDQYTAGVAPSAFRFSPGSGVAVGQSIVLWSTGSATAFVDLSQPTNRLALSAEARQCEGPPRIEVAIDDRTYIGREVAGLGYYGVAGDWAAGRHKVTLRYTNDLVTENCDRNVVFRSLVFSGPRANSTVVPVFTGQFHKLLNTSISPVTAGSISSEAGGSRIIPRLWSPGNMDIRLDSQGANFLSVVLRVDACEGLPSYRITVDGVVRSEGVVPEPFGEERLSFIAAGGGYSNRMHDVRITMSDDRRTATCDRSIALIETNFTGFL